LSICCHSLQKQSGWNLSTPVEHILLINRTIFSALSNEALLKNQEAGWLVFGVDDKSHKVVGSEFRPNRTDLDSLKKEIADKTSKRLYLC